MAKEHKEKEGVREAKEAGKHGMPLAKRFGGKHGGRHHSRGGKK